ncbi:MAG TPA: replicative DNA helicase, partial [Candidatus Deferrimicrobiaceae bacterium]
NLTSGFQKSDLVVVAARPAMGKTSICLNIAASAAIKGKVPILIFSLEMSRQQLALRMICSDARVNSNRLRTGHITQDEMNKLVASVARFSEAPIFIDDSGSLTPLELRAKARRLAKEKKIEMIIVDYLQLMQGSRGGRAGFDNRAQEISEISRGLKALAKELKIPVIAISQLNRRLEERPDKRPQMSDIRESGAVEQDSDLILFVYREEVYAKKGEPVPPDVKGVAEIIIGKHRNGPIGMVQLAFIDQYTRFEDLARQYE